MILSISGKIGSGKDTTGKIMQILIDNPHFVNNAVKVFLKRDLLKPTFTIEKWGGTLKDITCLLIGCTREQLEDEDFKNTELNSKWVKYRFINKSNPLFNSKWYSSQEELDIAYETYKSKYPKDLLVKEDVYMTPRLLLQLLGTECGRHIIHPNIWINALMSKYKPKCNNYCGRMKQADDAGCSSVHDCDCLPDWIITDTRFPNEHKAVLNKGGINIRVNRSNQYSQGLTKSIVIQAIREVFKVEHESETALDKATFDYTIDNNGTLDDLIDKIRDLLITLKLI